MDAGSATPEMPATHRLAAALGRPVPPDPTPQQVAEFEEAQDRADEEIVRFYGLAERDVA